MSLNPSLPQRRTMPPVALNRCHRMTNIHTGERCWKPLAVGHVFAYDVLYHAYGCAERGHDRWEPCHCYETERAAA